MNSLNDLGTDKISTLIYKYSLPAIIAMVVNAVYSIIDRMFIGKYVGANALAGLTITFPLTNILFAFGLLIGIGSSSLVSNKLGAKDYKGASNIFGTAVVFGVVTTFVMCTFSYINRKSILVLLGGTPEIIPYAENYLNIILLGFIFSIMAFILSNLIRAEGKPIFTMVSMVAACITNIIFDYIFIALCGFGVQGAALATIIGQFVSLVIVLFFYLSKQTVLTFSKEDFIFKFSIAKDISKIGFSSFIVNAGNALTLIFMNLMLVKYGGTDAIAAIGIVFSMQTMVFMPVFGLREGLQTIMSYNYGADIMDRVYETFFKGLKISGFFMTACWLAFMIFPGFFTGFFIDKNSEIFEMTIHTARIMLMFIPFYGIQFLGLSLFQATNRGQISNIITIAKQIVVIPFIFISPLILGLDGVYIASVGADVLAIILVVIFIIKEYREDKTKMVETA